MKKFNSSRGETLIEVLASVLIATLSVALLFSCIMASSSLDSRIQKVDYAHYEALAAAEKQEVVAESSGINVKIENTDPSLSGGTKSVDIRIEVYGGEDMYSYKREGT